MPNAELVSRDSNTAHVKVVFDAVEVRQQFQRVYREYANGLKLPGFRKGKIPANVIRQRVGTGPIAGAVREALHETALDTAIDVLQLLPRRGRPTWASDPEPAEDDTLTLDFSFAVYPNVTVPDYCTFEFTLPSFAVTEGMKERYYQRLRERMTEFPEKEGEAQSGDAVMATLRSRFSASGEDSPFASESVLFEIGKEGNLPGWDEQLTGKRGGESVEFDYTMPADYDDPRIAGQPLRVALDVRSIHAVQAPPFDDAYVKEHFGSESLVEYDKWVVAQLQLERDRFRSQMMRDLVVQKLVEGVEGDFTEEVIAESIDGLVREHERDLLEHGASLEQQLAASGKSLEEYRESLRSMALSRVKLNLAVRAIAAKEDLRATVDDFQRYAAYLAQSEGITPKQFRELLQHPEFTSEMTHQIMRNKVLDFLVACAKFTTAAPDSAAVEEAASALESGPDRPPGEPAADS
jgi:trigger factor